MDYGRFNYVAQPGDGARLIPIIGPYDEFAVEWGYREFPDAKTYEQEKKELEKITARQIEDAKLRFGDPNPREDPSQQTEDLGSDADPRHRAGPQEHRPRRRLPGQGDVEDGRELRPAAEHLRPAPRPAQPRAGPRRQRRRRLRPAPTSGIREGKKVFDARPGRPAEEGGGVPHRARLPHAALADRPGHPRPARVARQPPSGSSRPSRCLLRSLVNKTRLDRMSEQAAREPRDAYTPADLIKDLHAGIWSELKADADRDRPLPPQPPARLCRPAGRLPRQPDARTATCPPWPAPSWKGCRRDQP